MFTNMIILWLLNQVLKSDMLVTAIEFQPVDMNWWAARYAAVRSSSVALHPRPDHTELPE